jgi:type I restriction enzyme, R subunit
VRLNRTRVSYQARLQQLIAEYNAGSLNVEVFFERLITLAQDLNTEEQRAVRERLSEEVLALFDLLVQGEDTLTEHDRDQVKRAARDLLATLKREKLTLDWRKRQESRAQVRLVVEKTLDEGLPHAFTTQGYQRACDVAYQHHVFEVYADATYNRYVQIG